MFFKFKQKLIRDNLSENTIKNYIYSCNAYINKYKTISKQNLLCYKNYLLENNKPKTVNSRILGINRYLDFIGKPELKLKEIKLQQKTFLENVITKEDYEYFKTCLLNDSNLMWYFVVRTLGATGSRVSELIQFKVENMRIGYIDIYTKGGKIRRIYVPKKLQNDCLKWLYDNNITSGFIFCNKKGSRITTRGIAHQLKVLARKYKINERVVYPHSFRHLYAKSFLSKYNDIALLADLLGHDSLETTRIYLRKTSEEQKIIVDNNIDW